MPTFEYEDSDNIKVYERANRIDKGPLNLNKVKCAAFEIGVFKDTGAYLSQKIYLRIKTDLIEANKKYEVKRTFE